MDHRRTFAAALAAATVLLSGGCGLSAAPGSSSASASAPEATRTPQPKALSSVIITLRPTPAPMALTDQHGNLRPGTYYLDSPFPAHISFYVGALWLAVSQGPGLPGLMYHSQNTGWGIVFATVASVPVDPCAPGGATQGPAVTTSTDALVQALTHLPGLDATSKPVTAGDLSGTEIELTQAYDSATCPQAAVLKAPSTADLKTAFGDVHHLFQLWVLDVSGTPLVIRTTDYPESTDYMDSLGGYPHNPEEWTAAQNDMHRILSSIKVTDAMSG